MPNAFITAGDNVKCYKSGLDLVPFVLHNSIVTMEPDYPFAKQGQRLRWLRQAERIRTGVEFAKFMKWGQPGYSQFETGARSIPANKALELARKIPGFDPLWLWEGDKRGLSFDLRRRIEAEEAKETDDQLRRSGERQDVSRK